MKVARLVDSKAIQVVVKRSYMERKRKLDRTNTDIQREVRLQEIIIILILLNKTKHIVTSNRPF